MNIDRAGKLLAAIVAFIVFVFLSFDLYANPFLVSDPQPDTEGFRISWDNGTTWLECGDERTSDTEIRIKHDLSSVSVGRHEIQVKAYNVWGESSAVPFVFTKRSPPSPMNIGLEP